ncbi:BspA family leucine-rich repeat surface protein [Brachyspira intermedia]|uniref:BspA family leucine-rich repeat surface protein n=1 Tax=Brachyspira intermedia TaxID=84377 RepID=UPI003007492F
MKYKPQTKDELKELVKDENIYLGDIDTSLITDMSALFLNNIREDFSGIETWDVSHVTSMGGMFKNTVNFNHNINNWNVSNVRRIAHMFNGTESFNYSIENWIINEGCSIWEFFSGASSFKDTKSILNIYFLSKKVNDRKKLLNMLENCDIKEVYKEVIKYNKLKDFIKKLENTYYDELKELIENKDSIISEYKKSKSNKLELKDNEKYKPKDKIELLKLIKEKIKFDKIDTSLITDMSGLFQNSKLKKFNCIETWDTSNVEDMHNMFRGALHFNHNINNWNVSKVVNMEHMFSGCELFNQPLNNWDVSNVKYMAFMFTDCSSFDSDLSNWNVSNVESMEYMFENAYSFNQDISKWNISKVKKLYSMFEEAKSFNQPLNDWDMSNIESIHGMFKGASSFNQPLDKWNMFNIKDISFAFAYCINFNQDLESWKLGENVNMKYVFVDSPIENNPPSWYKN